MQPHLIPPPHRASDGTAFRCQGELSKTLELVDESSRRSTDPDKVMACEVWGDGVVALLSSGRVKAVSGIHGSNPRQETFYDTGRVVVVVVVADFNGVLLSARVRSTSAVRISYWMWKPPPPLPRGRLVR